MITNKIIRVSLKPYNERRITFLMENLAKLVELYGTLGVHPNSRFDRAELFGFTNLVGGVSQNLDVYSFDSFDSVDDNDEIVETRDFYTPKNDNLPKIKIVYNLDFSEVHIEHNGETFTYMCDELDDLLDFRFESIEE